MQDWVPFHVRTKRGAAQKVVYKLCSKYTWA